MAETKPVHTKIAQSRLGSQVVEIGPVRRGNFHERAHGVYLIAHRLIQSTSAKMFLGTYFGIFWRLGYAMILLLGMTIRMVLWTDNGSKFQVYSLLLSSLNDGKLLTGN